MSAPNCSLCLLRAIVASAQRLFDAINFGSASDVVSVNSLLQCFVQNARDDDAIALYAKYRAEDEVARFPNDRSLLSLFRAFASLNSKRDVDAVMIVDARDAALIREEPMNIDAHSVSIYRRIVRILVSVSVWASDAMRHARR